MLLSAFESSKNERIPCVFCGSLKFRPVHLRENNTLVVHCEECSLEFVNPLPTVEAMKENYQKEWLPLNKITLDTEKTKNVLSFLETLEDDDDVQYVYANLEVANSHSTKDSSA